MEDGLPAHERRLEQRSLRFLEREWAAGRRSGPPVDAAQVSRFLGEQVQALAARVALIRARQAEFTQRLAAATTPAAKRLTMIEFAAQLGATRAQLRGDRRAFRRWFGPDALMDRVAYQIGQHERTLVFALRGIGRLAPLALQQRSGAPAWRELQLEEPLEPLLRWTGDARVRTHAFLALAESLAPLAPEEATQAMQPSTVAYVYRASLDPSLDIWIQREAMTLLAAIAPDQVATVLRRRLREPAAGDDLFVRRHAVEMLGRSLHIDARLADLLAHVADDPSAHVRQAAAQVIPSMPADVVRVVWPRLGQDEPVAAVAAAAFLQLPLLASREELADAALGWIQAALDPGQKSAFLARVALHAAEDGGQRLQGSTRERWIAAVMPAVEAMHVGAQLLPVRRWAALTRERLWLASDDEARAVAEALAPQAHGATPGGGARTLDLPVATPEPILGRVMSVLTQRDFPLDVSAGGGRLRAWRGHQFGFRLWRFLHEWRHPSPDKRQAHRHTIGRIFHGTLRAPSAILAELAQTKVPGEPLQMATESGWRPYLPLVDELLSLLEQDPAKGPLRLYTAEGVTEVDPPLEPARRLRARSALTRRFAHYASARNWVEGSAAHPNTYLRMLAELGFEFRFRPHPGTSADSAVLRFFSATPLGMASLPEFRARIENYFFSAYENTLFDLALFIAGGLVAFLGHHMLVNRSMRRAREAIPLVVGGWGTRGKSGTERLKAAMFNGQGYCVVSKTTGCEAMFVYSKPFGAPRELFLFRPYDKATIWEQFNVVRLARRLGCEVFLWECMALTPSFVRLMQRAWMRDDMATLTNTFPDHEDLQGPAGIDIPQVMTNFIPERGLLFTTEEQMRPILQEAADRLGTRLKGVGWLESGLIAPDVLARFPYQEHPDNIALVTALGAELGYARDFALKSMADHVVPDLGVLKTFPPARVSLRVLEFSNGMSANERYGCLGNWTRLGFDTQDFEAEPGVMISTVVNNRADRIARSRVFAGVIAEDIQADVHLLIGGNVDGLKGYIRESWAAHAAALTLWPEQPVEGGPAAVLRLLARRYRVVHSETLVRARLEVMLASVGAPKEILSHSGSLESLQEALAPLGLEHADEVLRFHGRDLESQREFAQIAQRVEQAGTSAQPELDAALRQQMTVWFERRIHVVEDYYATGDAVIARVRDATPPGFRNRVMGIQNIKGTGLDFVYRWLAWDTCARACDQLASRDTMVQRKGLLTLTGFQEWGVLTHDRLRERLGALRETSLGQQASVRAQIDAIAASEAAAMERVRAQMQSVRRAGWLDTVFGWLEGMADATDAIRRRRRADRIYRDLVTRRIGEARAVSELQALTQRQKGGWLRTDVGQKLRSWGRG
ncbi:hypothetical protein [Ramlibacter rhizophilus]|uniref:Poly-gamma-glutamate synthase PgsB n=1 Tax=Ramlibacter rhizophilus TaxID=1781167 RepID=A0A4Z0C2G5_9BURK|nr:hypothetical protein [Ramlibacter rhizophilus]TFZ05034.1 hypothetical protein EZ242_04610 [Ramlibacter rhizophilus]